MLKPKNALVVQSTAASALETERDALERRRELLEARAASAKATHAAAAAARRLLLVEHDNPPAAELARADREVRDAIDARDAAIDALAEIDTRVITLRTRIDRIRVNEGRERDAAALEAGAKSIDAIMARVAALASEIGKERAALVDALSTKSLGCYDPPARSAPGVGAIYLTTTTFDAERRSRTETLSAAVLGSRLVGHVLAPVLPTLGICDAHMAGQPHVALSVTPVLGSIEDAVASEVLITSRMREFAAEVRGGTDKPEPKDSDIVVGERTVYVIEPVHYTNGKLPATILSAWVCTIPVPVADRLLELGLSLNPKSAEAERAMEAKREYDLRSPMVIDTVEPLTLKNTRDIGFDMVAWRTAELERRRAVWRAGLPS